MKATVVISTEYRMNQPSVFIMVNGMYFGCQIYPASRNYPESPEYWVNATCSDDNRYFHVKDVDCEEVIISKIADLQTSVNANSKLLKSYPSYSCLPSFKIKRGKAYQEYLKIKISRESEMAKIQDYNKAYEKAIYSASKELRDLILSLK